MFEIIIAIVVVICMIYIFKGDFFRKQVAVTVVESLPLTIFKKSTNGINEQENMKKSEKESFSIKEIQYESDQESSEALSESFEKNKVIDNVAEEVNNKRAEEAFLELACEDLNGEENYEFEINEKLVYWTPKGKTYHIKSTCRTLMRSKVVHSGTIYESGKEFQCEHCK